MSTRMDWSLYYFVFNAGDDKLERINNTLTDWRLLENK